MDFPASIAKRRRVRSGAKARTGEIMTVPGGDGGDGRASAERPGPRTVLLVEDSGMVRDLAREILVMGGYRVLEAGSAERALVVLSGHEGPIDALVTDLQMPGMGGRELADRLRAERPGLSVVFISGFTEAAARVSGALGPGESFLEKPFSPMALIRRVREATGEQ